MFKPRGHNPKIWRNGENNATPRKEPENTISLTIDDAEKN